MPHSVGVLIVRVFLVWILLGRILLSPSPSSVAGLEAQGEVRSIVRSSVPFRDRFWISRSLRRKNNPPLCAFLLPSVLYLVSWPARSTALMDQLLKSFPAASISVGKLTQ